MEEKIVCQIPTYFKKLEEAKAAALKAKNFKVNSVSPNPLCRYRLGTTTSEYKCYHCDALDRLADMSGPLVDQPFTVKNAKASCRNVTVAVRKSELSEKAFEAQVYAQWLISDLLKEKKIEVPGTIFSAFRCDTSLYTLEHVLDPYSFKDTRKDVNSLLLQLLVYHNVLKEKGFYLSKAELVLEDNPTAYSYLAKSGDKEIKVVVRSSFTLALRNVVISSKDSYSLQHLVFNAVKDWPQILDLAFSFWAILWPENMLEKLRAAKELKQFELEKYLPQKDLFAAAYANIHS